MEIGYQELWQMNPVEARRKMVETYRQTRSVSGTARVWGTSRQVVRKWVRRYEEMGEKGLLDAFRRPLDCPRKTKPDIEEKVISLRKETGYGPRRLQWSLQMSQGVFLSPHTIRHILRRNELSPMRIRMDGRRGKRKVCYPGVWAWEERVLSGWHNPVRIRME